MAAAIQAVAPYAEQVVLVDDGSSDGTAEAARAAGAVVLRHLINRGYGAALITGSTYAFKAGADVIVHFDADGQFDAADIPKLVAGLATGKPSVALGSRFMGSVHGISFIRRLTLKFAILFTWAVSGIKLTDAHNGLRAFTREAWQLMQFQQDRMAYSSEVIDELARLKLAAVEVPVTVRYTDYSRKSSKQGRFPVLRILRDMFVGRLTR